jgi:intracellular sulfur oxidation DsrE/DsrF family protein
MSVHHKTTAWQRLGLVFCLLALMALHSGSGAELELPELGDIQWIVKQDEAPPGVVFDIREYDEDALVWVGPRLERYVELLRQRFPGLPVAVISHGDEMLALQARNRPRYPRVHRIAQHLANDLHILIQVCGTFAALNGIGEDDFPDYIEVVPYGPSQLADYLQIGYEHVTLELTW